MGLFDLFKKSIKANNVPSNKRFCSKVEEDMYINNTMGYRDRKDHLDYQSSLLKSIGAAETKYSKDGDILSLIKAYEYAFYESKPPCISSANLKLVDLYLKQGLYDKAWGYLNYLQANELAPIEKIRHQQARILKKEKRFIPAIDMILSEYLVIASGGFAISPQKVSKDVGICVHALKWDNSVIDDTVTILLNQVNAKNYDELVLRNTYKQYLESRGLLTKEN